MNGFIKQTAMVTCFAASLLVVIGCQRYREVVDPCWPERYASVAHSSVIQMTNAQADKGHLLNQTLWNADFDGEKLKPSGMEKLKYIAHREPVAVVMKVYLQNSDLEDPAKRSNMNGARRAAILNYLANQKAENRQTLYEVEVHNYTQPTYPAAWTGFALENIEKNTKNGRIQQFEQPATQSGSGGSK